MGTSARSRNTKMLKRNAHAVLVYCRKMAAAAVVRVIAVTKSRFMPANVITKGISMGRHRTCRGFTNRPNATAAANTRKQARIGPREPSGMAASGGLLTNAPLVLHKSEARATIIRPRRSEAACAAAAAALAASEDAGGSTGDSSVGSFIGGRGTSQLWNESMAENQRATRHGAPPTLSAWRRPIPRRTSSWTQGTLSGCRRPRSPASGDAAWPVRSA